MSNASSDRGNASDRATRTDTVIALSLGLTTTIAVGITATSVGFTRDEGYYFKAAELYWRWYRSMFDALVHGRFGNAFSTASIDRFWSYNHEHPAVMKTLFAWAFGVHELTGFPEGPADAIRFPAWVIAGLSVTLLFAFARMLLPRRAAVVAALLWACMPHVFWHMHIACFDVPVATAHLGFVCAYWRWRKTWKGAIAVGALFGIAAGVKHNVLPVPGLLALHWFIFEAPRPSRVPQRAGVAMPPVPLVFGACALVGPLVYFAHWPWLWPAPIARFSAYLSFHIQHEHYPILWFHELLTRPPFPVSFPFVMSAITIPLPTLMLVILGVALGSVVSVRLLVERVVSRGATRDHAKVSLSRVPIGGGRDDASGAVASLLVLNALYPFILIAWPSTPIFGGTKHWMSGLPFLCILGAWALEEAAARARAAGVPLGPSIVGLIVMLTLAPGAFISMRVWPYGLGAYNELIGFTRGAANAGMQRTFWGYEVSEALSVINARTPRDGTVHWGDTNADSWRMYRRTRGKSRPLLREDIGFSSVVRGADVACVQPQGEFKDQWMDVWNTWSDRTPDVVLHAEGVPMLTVTFRQNPGAQLP